MMTWSGLIFFLFLYMPAAQRALFPDDDAMMRFNVEAYFPQDGRTHEGPASPASSASLPEVVAQAERLWGAGSVLSLRIENPGRANARVTAFTRRAEIAGETRTAFDAATGAPLPVAARRTAPSKFYSAILGLHEGHFAWSYLRMLYVLGGLAGTALVGTGLVQWSVKRRPKPDERTSRHLGMAVVDVLNLGTIVGLPIGIGAYFWANRLLPLDLAGRADWEAHVMFIAWAAIYLYAAVRPQNRAWPEVCALAAMIYGLIPVLNALTTDRHLGVTIPAGDWVLAGFDLSALAAGVFFAVVARTIWRKQRPHGAARVIETAPVGKPEMA